MRAHQTLVFHKRATVVTQLSAIRFDAPLCSSTTVSTSIGSRSSHVMRKKWRLVAAEESVLPQLQGEPPPMLDMVVRIPGEVLDQDLEELVLHILLLQG